MPFGPARLFVRAFDALSALSREFTDNIEHGSLLLVYSWLNDSRILVKVRITR